MTAFDQAWALLKMPIVPGSLQNTPISRLPEGPDRFDEHYEADFEDPDTGEIVPMKAKLWTNDDPDTDADEMTMDAHIMDRSVGTSRRAATSIQPHRGTRDLSMRSTWSPQNISVGGNFRRRGYGTALYDMLATILSREDWGTLMPSIDRSEAAHKLWRSQRESSIGGVRDANTAGWRGREWDLWNRGGEDQ